MTFTTFPTRISEPRIPTWTVGERLRKAREDAGYSQAAFEEETGISKRKIIYLENNSQAPKKSDLLLWEGFTGVPQSWLLGSHEGPESPDPSPSHYMGNVRAFVPRNRPSARTDSSRPQNREAA